MICIRVFFFIKVFKYLFFSFEDFLKSILKSPPIRLVAELSKKGTGGTEC